MPPPLRLFEWSDRDSDEYESKNLSRALANLSNELTLLSNQITDIRDNLEDEYPGEALKVLANQFSDIAEDWISYTKRKRSDHYLVLARSRERMSTAKNIVNEAKAVSKLFERYGKRPHTYSRIESRIKIKGLLETIGNLKDFCRSI